MLQTMMELHEDPVLGRQWRYNEVVADPAHMVIEAVFECKYCNKRTAQDVHARLLEHHGLNANQLPLLSGDWLEEAIAFAGR